MKDAERGAALIKNPYWNSGESGPSLFVSLSLVYCVADGAQVKTNQAKKKLANTYTKLSFALTYAVFIFIFIELWDLF